MLHLEQFFLTWNGREGLMCPSEEKMPVYVTFSVKENETVEKVLTHH